MARSKLRLLCTSMLVAILLFLYAALLCSCKTADPEISGTMWVELSLDGQYALTNAAARRSAISICCNMTARCRWKRPT